MTRRAEAVATKPRARRATATPASPSRVPHALTLGHDDLAELARGAAFSAAYGMASEKGIDPRDVASSANIAIGALHVLARLLQLAGRQHAARHGERDDSGIPF